MKLREQNRMYPFNVDKSIVTVLAKSRLRAFLLMKFKKIYLKAREEWYNRTQNIETLSVTFKH